MKRLIVALSIFTMSLHGHDIKTIYKESGAFAKEMNSTVLENAKNLDPKEYTPEEDLGKEFDSKDAKEKLSTSTYAPPVQKQTSNPYLDENEFLFKRSDLITQDDGLPIFDAAISEFQTETCQEADAPFTLVIERSLDVKVTHHPEEKITLKICQGHKESKKHFWKADAEKEKKKQEQWLSSDPTIKAYTVKIKKGQFARDYVVKWTWEHFDDAPKCDDSIQQIKTVQPESWQEEDTWIYTNNSDLALSSSNQCTFLGTKCLDSGGNKVIGGQNVHRPCWLEQLKYACRFQKNNKCEFLKQKNCLLDYKRCIYTSDSGCALWEMVFKCASKISREQMQDSKGILGTNAEDWETAYGPNTSFQNVATTLSIFDEIKRELEGSQVSDATRIQLFRGQKCQCAKSVADNVMYDCCFSYKGLANQVKLSKCTADEVTLEDLRDRGLCHYIGSYEEKFLGLWTSRTEHVYCCFPSKISRVFQEGARKQLNIGWGEPKHPDCRGLSQEEISKLDFSKLDLSEAFGKIPETTKVNESQQEFQNQERIKLMEEKLKEKISQMNSGTNV